jgi:hypothetical protein
MWLRAALSLIMGTAIAVCLYGLMRLAAIGDAPRDNYSGPRIDIENYICTADGKPICPHCGKTEEIREYLYGLVRDVPPGRIYGCVISEDSPRYKCLNCETRFGRVQMPRFAG